MAGDREEVGDDGACGIYFGVSCAFLALDLMSKKRFLDVDRSRVRLGEMMLKGSAQLLGLLVERAQGREEETEKKLKRAEVELAEMRWRRTEDAKANEKVVAIFATHEQRWIAERKSLRLQIHALLNELQIVKSKHDDAISNLERRVEEGERVKDEALEEEARKRRELEEKLRLVQEVADEMTERAKKAAQDHSAELWKHKTAFVELVSSQRQLEAELSRALRQAEAAERELEEVFDRKHEAVATAEKLSEQLAKMQKDSEQKDKILSAMLRKSKLDTAERQMLLKEVKMSKAKKKQAELEMERWRNMYESRHKKSSREFHSAEVGSSQNGRLDLLPLECSAHNSRNILDCLEDEGGREDSSTRWGENILTAIKCCDHYSNDEAEIAMDDYQQLQDWIRKETEKYTSILEQKHYAEIEAFAEQMRQKDEKLEAFRWRVLSLELEAKRLKSHIEGLDGNLSHLKEENIKFESMLLDKEQEIKSLKEQLSFHVHVQQNLESNNSHYFPCAESSLSQDLWSEVKITKKKQKEKSEDSRASLLGDIEKDGISKEEKDAQNDAEEIEISKTDSAESPSSPTNNFQEYIDRSCYMLSPQPAKSTESSPEAQLKSITLISNSAGEEIEEKEVNLGQVKAQVPNGCHEEAKIIYKLQPITGSSLLRKDTSWKMDIQALGVSYKIKRLKQQLVALEKLVASPAVRHITSKDDASSTHDGSNDKKNDENKQQIKALLLLKSSLNKQLKRYQSLEVKTDDLCRRMNENYRSGSRRELQNGRTKEQTETLEHFLEETFQLQRYMVATGQKLMEMQSRITPSFHGAIRLDESVGFNMGQFADIVRTLFRDIQRGLEVRIARIIGDLEGTLASDGILHR